jgi:hypothetical protein
VWAEGLILSLKLARRKLANCKRESEQKVLYYFAAASVTQQKSFKTPEVNVVKKFFFVIVNGEISWSACPLQVFWGNLIFVRESILRMVNHMLLSLGLTRKCNLYKTCMGHTL